MDLPIVSPNTPTSVNEIIRLSETAAGKVRELLAQRGTPEQGLRIGVRGGGCSVRGGAPIWAPGP